MIIKLGKYYYTQKYLIRGVLYSGVFIILLLMILSLFFRLNNWVHVGGIAIIIYLVLLGFLLGEGIVTRNQAKQKILKEKYEIQEKQ